MVDIRYVLWIIDHYAGASHLVDEMTLIDSDGEDAGLNYKQEVLVSVLDKKRDCKDDDCKNY